MQKLLLVIVLLCSCSQAQNKPPISVVNNCLYKANLAKPNENEVAFCLPKIENYQECYSLDVVKQRIKILAPTFNLIAVYEPDSIYERIKASKLLDDVPLKDYLIVNHDTFSYSTEKYNYYLQRIAGTCYNEKWEGIRNDINNDQGETFKEYFKTSKIEKGLLVGKYSLAVNSNSLTMLFNLKGGIQICYANLIRIENKVVVASYYTDFVNHLSLSKGQKVNDFLVQKLINANK